MRSRVRPPTIHGERTARNVEVHRRYETVLRDRYGRARYGTRAAGRRRAGAAFPMQHAQTVAGNLREVHVRAFGIARIALDARTHDANVDRGQVVDEDHDVRVTDVDRRRTKSRDVVRRADCGTPITSETRYGSRERMRVAIGPAIVSTTAALRPSCSSR